MTLIAIEAYLIPYSLQDDTIHIYTFPSISQVLPPLYYTAYSASHIAAWSARTKRQKRRAASTFCEISRTTKGGAILLERRCCFFYGEGVIEIGACSVWATRRKPARHKINNDPRPRANFSARSDVTVSSLRHRQG